MHLSGISTSAKIPRVFAAASSVLRSKRIIYDLQQTKNENETSGLFFSSGKRTCCSSSNGGDGGGKQQLASKLLPQQKILLPQHGQNGTLLLRSISKSIGRVDIIPQWRDDTMLELMPTMSTSGETDDYNDATTTASTTTNVDNNISAIKFQYNDQSSLTEKQTVSYGGLHFTLHRDGISTALGRKGSLVEVDVDVSSAADNNHAKNNVNIHEKDAPLASSQLVWNVVLTVPEKSNVTCILTKGNIHVMNKLEGDVHLKTASGDIKVSKLRGHNVTLNNCFIQMNNSNFDVDDKESNLISSSSCSSPPGVIFVQKGIESQAVRISSSNRVRARMVNGSDVSVHVVVPQKFATIDNTVKNDQNIIDKLDEDDAGFRIDIGSLYISGGSKCEARLDVDELDSSTNGLIRIKSSHGHVMAHAKTKHNNESLAAAMQLCRNDSYHPLVDLGGVNGSCDVNLEIIGNDSDVNTLSHATQKSDCEDSNEKPVMTRVHFDSLSPDSISTIKSSHLVGKAGEAMVNVTVDRKVEADIRLLALNIDKSESMSKIDMDLLTSDELDDVASALLNLNEYVHKDGNCIAAKTTESIYIETESFDPMTENKMLPDSQCFDYKQGTIRNRSGEPDSRFDIRSSPSPSRGKINIDSAASQALSGFQGFFENDDDCHLPLLAVATNGKIKLETLSWLGSIARRYGLEEGGQELGRTASRRPRLR